MKTLRILAIAFTSILLLAGQQFASPVAYGQIPDDEPWNFPVNGQAITENTAWKDMSVNIIGRYCRTDGLGCGDPTDKITYRVTTNPGSITQNFDWNKTYSPNGGNFKGGHIDVFAVIDGAVRGGGEQATETTSSGRKTWEHSSAASNSIITAYAFWALKPDGSWQSATARTTGAKCEPISVGNVCKYNQP
ncbi:hypothetical protein [Rhodococcus opacus]|uniref:Uncharacterized protein n=1 Tax=Rhodococcus opacus (strain B4) TaxID=632772 RepID=C1BCL5_RHOOB|nr:hypothetical protein [Rhodococcus opacus]BAH56070.1 hypothetical protein ROP_pROB01-05710 [Rhodococcus opacus B4]